MLALLIALGVAAWAWRSGRLKALGGRDGAALVAAVLGLALLGRGHATAGLALLAGAGLWAAWRGRRSPPSSGAAMDAAEAYALLDLPQGADAAAVRAAYRRLMARVHPDAGGSAALARRVTAARDIALAALNRDAAQASGASVSFSKDSPR